MHNIQKLQLFVIEKNKKPQIFASFPHFGIIF